MKLPTLKKSLRSLGKAPVLAAEAGAPRRSRLLGIGALAAVGVLAAVFFLRPAHTRCGIPHRHRRGADCRAYAGLHSRRWL